ncbi:GNAT family N-acetyltransferase [Myxococcus sp. CA051A]|uniref:GNAT family N-acetyltransferase n=1 Tax=Myxococcus sp. CA051A TaxID=2741739 RepID=UPI00157B6E43|nr:GNAT family N-acetyltransferase [Myxococcus sp. CA051A]NTX61620.1 GNAT family N-acetyltransferase [Myxococcus sp. CA051A]
MSSSDSHSRVAILPATLEDGAWFAALERASGELFRQLDDLAWIADDDVMEEADHRPFILARTVWVARDAEAGVVGFLTAQAVGSALHVWQMAVHPSHQRRGLGRALLRAAAAHAREAGLSTLTLTTFLDVPWNEPFYVGLGFTRIPDDALDDRLREVLEHEARAGLPRERRCALWLDPRVMVD